MVKNIDYSFSPETRALMGEWLTHYAFAAPRQMYCDNVGQALSIRKFFEHGAIDRNLGCVFNVSDCYSCGKNFHTSSLLASYGIVGPTLKANCDYKPIVSYDSVKQTFLDHLNNDNEPISPCFAYFMVDMTKSENDAFVIESGCEPLVEILESSNFLRSKAKHYFWTEKIRPLFEYSGRWKPRKFVSKEKRIVDTFSKDFLATIDKCLREKGFQGALEILRQRSDVQQSFFISESHKASPIKIMEIIYPQFSDKKIPSLRWFGEVPEPTPLKRFSGFSKVTKPLFGKRRN